ncbi:MAG: hypothetical protein ACOZQL_03090 [Myxococcota bacterium]
MVHPPLQTLRARVLTGAGWLEGSFHLGKVSGLGDYLANHDWYPLTDVVMTKVGTMPFLALSKRETSLVVAPDDTVAAAHQVEHKVVSTTLLLPDGSVDGKLELAANMRLSDYVDRAKGFMLVEGANVKVWADPLAHYFEKLYVNPARLVGVTEPETPK